ncbi:MAG: hypothetical protein M3176_02415, partial [Chloroflexota bacterium]|nr:hypothetical protein [Chloroflexota bacterium]
MCAPAPEQRYRNRTLSALLMKTMRSLAQTSRTWLTLFLLSLVSAATIHAQSAVDGFDPNANDSVYAVAVQADGKIVIGGGFTTVAPNGGPTVTRNHIARLNPDGTLDAAFNPDIQTGVVYSLVVQPDGKILVGGAFAMIAGQTRRNIARLDPATGSADAFQANVNNIVRAVALEADGKVLIVGLFNAVDNQPRNYIARLDATTGAADSFDPNAGPFAQLWSVAVQADGKILAGGSFSTIGGQPRRNLARLDPVTGLADSFNPSPNNLIYALTVQPDGKILVGGTFNVISGATRYDLARLDPVTGAAETFNPSMDGGVFSISVQPDGKILAAGSFFTVATQSRTHLARLNPTTGAPDGFDPSPNNTVWSIALQPDGKLVAAGDFNIVAPNGGAAVTRNRVARFLPSPVPTAVVSRKFHNGVPFDINLPLTGGPGIECRSGGATNDYQVVFTFPGAVTFTSAAVTAGTGGVSAMGGSGTTVITVNLTGVTNAQRLTLTLANVNNGANNGDVGVQLGVLLGDTNGDGSVN